MASKPFTFFKHHGEIMKDYLLPFHLTISKFFVHIFIIYLGHLRLLIAKDISIENYWL